MSDNPYDAIIKGPEENPYDSIIAAPEGNPYDDIIAEPKQDKGILGDDPFTAAHLIGTAPAEAVENPDVDRFVKLQKDIGQSTKASWTRSVAGIAALADEAIKLRQFGPHDTIMTDWVRDLQQTAEEIDALPKNLKDPTLTEQALLTASVSLSQSIPIMASSLLTGPGAAVTAFGMLEMGRSYSEDMSMGMDKGQALAHSAVAGALEGVFEIPAVRAFGDVVTSRIKGQLGKKIAKFLAVEVGTENLTEASQRVNDWLLGGDEIPTAKEFKDIALLTTLSTVIAGGAQGALATGMNSVYGAVKGDPELKKATRELAEHLEIPELAQEEMTEEEAAQQLRDKVVNVMRWIPDNPKLRTALGIDEKGADKIKSIPLMVVEDAELSDLVERGIPQSGVEKTEEKLQGFLDEAVRRFAMEQQGQDVLDGMVESGLSPVSVSNRFWKNTYFSLNADTQKKFHRMLKGLGFEPGSIMYVDKDGKQIKANDWVQVAEFIAGDFPKSAEHLEGTERGYVSLMQWANDQADKNNPDKFIHGSEVSDDSGWIDEPIDDPIDQELLKTKLNSTVPPMVQSMANKIIYWTNEGSAIGQYNRNNKQIRLTRDTLKNRDGDFVLAHEFGHAISMWETGSSRPLASQSSLWTVGTAKNNYGEATREVVGAWAKGAEKVLKYEKLFNKQHGVDITAKEISQFYADTGDTKAAMEVAAFSSVAVPTEASTSIDQKNAGTIKGRG